MISVFCTFGSPSTSFVSTWCWWLSSFGCFLPLGRIHGPSHGVNHGVEMALTP